jgi:hypothetical protein
MQLKAIAVLALALLAPWAAPAQQAYVPIEQRLTPAQLGEVGLSPAQLETLNRLLRAAPAQDTAAPTHAPTPAPVAAQEAAATQHEPADPGGQPIRSRLKGPVHSGRPRTGRTLVPAGRRGHAQGAGVPHRLSRAWPSPRALDVVVR